VVALSYCSPPFFEELAMKPILFTTLSLCAGVLTIGCNEPVTNYGNAQKTETVNADFGSTDLQMIAETMVSSLLETNRITPDPAEPTKAPLIEVTRLVNNTSEHIDTKSITDKIRTSLIKSGKVRFSAGEAQADLMNQYKRQGVMADTNTAKTAGKQHGAKYILRGDISSIVKTSGRTKDVYYKITLNLVDVESAVIEWADEKEIRKDQVRKLIAF
jgi:uncharacterized protein (TIGR02722 family)